MQASGNRRRVGTFRGIWARLVLYFLLLLVMPLIIFTAIQYYEEMFHIREREVGQISSVADSRKADIRNWIRERKGDLALFSGDPLLQEGLASLVRKGTVEPSVMKHDRDYKMMVAQIQRFIRHIDYSGAALADPLGRVLVSSRESDVGLYVGGVDWFKGALEAGPAGVYIKDVFLDESTGSPTMGFAQVIDGSPYGREGFMGVAVMYYDLDRGFFPLVLNWPGKGETGETLLVTRRGDSVVYLNRLKFTDDQPTTFSFPAGRSWPKPALLSSGGGEGVIEARDYRGETVIAAYRYLPETNWGLVTKMDEAEVLEPVYHFRRWTLFFLLISAVLVAGLMVFLSRRIIRPIQLLAASTRNIARGDFTLDLPPGAKDEIGELTRSFSEMARALKASNEEVALKGEELEGNNRMLELLASSLEEKVIERTSELEALNSDQAKLLISLDERTKALEKSKEELAEFARQLEETRDRVSENLEIVERANVELRRIDYMKDQFLGMISHELRTPLSLIMGYSSNMLANPNIILDPAVEEEVEGIYKGAERLKNIISDMLDVSNIDSRGLKLKFEKGDIGALLKEVIDELEPFVLERKQRLEVDYGSGLPEVSFDRGRMYQVLVNIIGNAIKFTPDGGKISVQQRLHTAIAGSGGIRTLPQGDHIDIIITDSGIGLERLEIERIFDKFYEVGEIEKHTTSKYRFLGRGVGLGLPIARGIVEAHGGWLWAESDGYDPKTCPGSSFHIGLPVESKVFPPPDTAKAEGGGVVSASQGSRSETHKEDAARRRILVIEDDEDLGRLTEQVLDGRYEVARAASGSEGVELARRLLPDLVLLDVYMDGMNGYEVCSVLKEDPATKNILIAMFTAGVQKWEVEKGYQAGADDYITKPFKPSELLERVDDILSGRVAVRNNSVD